MTSQREDERTGCACLMTLVGIALAIVAVISLSAIVDPFDWMPPVGEVWEECDDDYDTEGDECALAARFPGFWVHAAVNLLWTIFSVVMLLALAGAVADLREARAARFDSLEAAERYGRARNACDGYALGAAVLAAAPILVALA